jgi:F-type H+-transporting ATPase subunit gamma
MPSRQIIGRRIRSVRNTRQITKAMQMVAASKLRRAQTAALGPQAYTAAARELLVNLSGQPVVKRHPLLAVRPVKRRLAIVVAGDRGLAGGYNSNVIRALARSIREGGLRGQSESRNLAICIGRRAAMGVARAADVKEIASFNVDADDVTSEIVVPVLEQTIGMFKDGAIDEVELITTEFISTVSQHVVTRRLLPVVIPADVKPRGDAEMEPDAEELVDAAIRRILTAELTQAVLEARASEQASRMLAMMNATDNADDIIDDLTLVYNNVRQSGITQQISEISAGAEAMAQA